MTDKEKRRIAVSKAQNRGEVAKEWLKTHTLNQHTLSEFNALMKQANKDWKSKNVMSDNTESRENKPVHAKPQLYAYYFIEMKEIAKANGYNLVVHGSMNRDLDLIAIPWVDDPRPELELIHELSKYLTGHRATDQMWKDVYMYSELAGGRHSYVINLNRRQTDSNGNYQDDPQYYIDISITPLPNKKP